MERTRLFRPSSGYETTCSVCASLLLHALLLLALSTSSSFDFSVGKTTRFDIFWVSPSSAAPLAALEPVDRPEPPVLKRLPLAMKEGNSEPTGDLRPAAPASAASPAPAITVPAIKEPPVVAQLRTISATAKAPASPARHDQSASQMVSPARDGHSASQPSKVAGPTPTLTPAAATVSPAGSGTRPATPPSSSVAAELPRAQVVQPESRTGSAEEAPEPRGAVIASLHGDLKMVIAGESGIKLHVLFREYPKSRRQRPLPRSEARRVQRIVPVSVKTQQDIREAVIETAREGIYIFSAEPEQGETAKATFTLKLFETGARERVAEIGTRTISGKTVLAKVLMRDGVLWNDDAAFTGSMEDSESITKFNAQTGLYWKEYLGEE